MGCRILESTDNRAVLYCSSTDVAFGPLFESRAEAEAFCHWLTTHGRADRCVLPEDGLRMFLGSKALQDPRSYSDAGLENQVADFRLDQACAHSSKDP